MASETLIKYFETAKKVIAAGGLTKDAFNAVKEASRTAFFSEKDREYGLIFSIVLFR